MASLMFTPMPDASAALRKIIFSPFLSGPLLLAAVYSPDALRQVVLKLADFIPQCRIPLTTFDLSTVKTALHVIFGLSIAHSLNQTLNTAAANSWRITASKGWDWPNEIAVVTGGASGIGQTIVEKLAALNIRVAVLDIQSMPKSMQDNPRIHFFKCDVTSPEAVATAADAIRQELGHPSILINNAGIVRAGSILNTTESMLRTTFDVNTLSHWFTTQQFLPHMIEADKGHIVTIASIASFVTLHSSVSYSATKASALSFHEGLACELRHTHKARNVLTTVVHPSFVRTPLLEGFCDWLESIGVRMLTPEQVAEPIVAQIKSRRGGQLIIPTSANILYTLRSWPNWMQEKLRSSFST